LEVVDRHLKTTLKDKIALFWEGKNGESEEYTFNDLSKLSNRFADAALPRSIPKLVYKMIHEGGVPSDRMEWHGHNDFHKVHINGATAWLYGCNAVNTTLMGAGERTGNPPLGGAVIEYTAIKGNTNGMDSKMITRIAEYCRNEVNVLIPEHYPFVGEDFIMTSAGIHADGLAKDERIYNIFNTIGLD